jgi:hypothetical protein
MARLVGGWWVAASTKLSALRKKSVPNEFVITSYKKFSVYTRRRTHNWILRHIYNWISVSFSYFIYFSVIVIAPQHPPLLPQAPCDQILGLRLKHRSAEKKIKGRIKYYQIFSRYSQKYRLWISTVISSLSDIYKERWQPCLLFVLCKWFTLLFLKDKGYKAKWLRE